MQNLIHGLGLLGSPSTIAYLFGGALLGLFVGAVPGLSLVVLLSIILVFTYHIDLTGSLCLFLGAQCGGFYSGSISAILFNTPAHPEAFPITFDGYPMTRAGHPGRALGLSAASTCIGGFIGCGVLIGFLAIIDNLTTVFLSAEYVGLIVLSMLLVGTLGADSVAKTLVAAGTGIALSSVGPSAITGAFRYTFGATGLETGVSVVALALGMFAIPQMMMLFGTGTASTRQDMTGKELEDVDFSSVPTGGYGKELLGGVFEAFRHWRMLLQGGIVGGVTGVIPGIGGFAGNIMAYGIARQTSRDRRLFGTGTPDGIIAPEASSLAKEAGHVIPIIGLGIPGGIVGALFIGLFSIKGINVGFQFQDAHPNVTGSIVWIIALSGLIGTVVGVMIGPQIARASALPGPFLVPFIYAICISGVFLTDQLFFSVIEILIFSVVGLVFRRLRYPLGPLVLGLVLGQILEQNIEHMRTFYPGLSFVVHRPVADVIFAAAVITLVAKWFELRRESRLRKEELNERLATAGESPEARKLAIEELEPRRHPYPFLQLVGGTGIIAGGLFIVIYGLAEYSSATATLPVVGGIAMLVPTIAFYPRDIARYVRYRRSRDLGGATHELSLAIGEASLLEEIPFDDAGAEEHAAAQASSVGVLAATELANEELALPTPAGPSGRAASAVRSWGVNGQYRRELVAFAWFAGLVGLSWLLGFDWGAAVFMVAYCATSLRSYFKTVPRHVIFTVISTAVVWLMTYEMFHLTFINYTPVI